MRWVFALARIEELVPGNVAKLKVTTKSVSIIGDRGELFLLRPTGKERGLNYFSSVIIRHAAQSPP